MKALWEYTRGEPVPYALLADSPCVRVACQEAGRCRCEEYGLRRRVNAGHFYELCSFGWLRAGQRASRCGKVSKGARARVMARDNSACVWCGSADSLEIDHVIPVSRGGKHDDANLRVLCQPCNREKWHHVDGEMGA